MNKNNTSTSKNMVDVAKKAYGLYKNWGIVTGILGLFTSFFGIVLFVVLFIVLDFGSSASGGSGGGGSSDPDISYVVDRKVVSNIKVRLLDCAGYDVLSDEELIDFETYILGVLYQEVGNTSYEALKAQAVAARSYAITRPGKMGGAYGLSLEEEDDEWILSLRSCTNDQAFCNPDRGCWSNKAGGQTDDSKPEEWSDCTIHSGYDSTKVWSKGALAADSDIRKAVEETKGQVLVNNDNEIIHTTFNATIQQDWIEMAENGDDYFEILMNTYGDSGATKIYEPIFEFNGGIGEDDSDDDLDDDSNNIITDVDMLELINMSQSEAWYHLIGRRTDERTPSVSKSTIELKTISVPYRAWSGNGSDPRINVEKKYHNITVNAALADLWLAFFTDVYNEATDFVIASFDGCYVEKKVSGTTSTSAHSYGAACDINAGTVGNEQNTISYDKAYWETLPNTRNKYQIIYKGSKVVEIAHRYTLINGSDWTSTRDSMHFSFIVDWSRSSAQSCQGKTICN